MRLLVCLWLLLLVEQLRVRALVQLLQLLLLLLLRCSGRMEEGSIDGKEGCKCGCRERCLHRLRGQLLQ